MLIFKLYCLYAIMVVKRKIRHQLDAAIVEKGITAGLFKPTRTTDIIDV